MKILNSLNVYLRNKTSKDLERFNGYEVYILMQFYEFLIILKHIINFVIRIHLEKLCAILN